MPSIVVLGCFGMVLLTVLSSVEGGGAKHRGNNFLVAFMPPDSSLTQPQDMLLLSTMFITTEVTITENHGSPPRPPEHEVYLQPEVGSVLEVDPHRQLAHHVYSNNTFALSAWAKFTVFVLHAFGDSYLALAVTSLDKRYYVLNSRSEMSQLVILASQRSSVHLLLPKDNSIVLGGITSRNLGQLNLTLHESEALIIQAHTDLSGTYIEADVDIGVLSGNVLTTTTSRRTLVEQLPPISTWGKRFVTMVSPEREAGLDEYRILSSSPDTSVTVGDEEHHLPSSGDSVTVEINSDTIILITSTQPVLIVKTAKERTGVPACLTTLVPMEQWMERYTLHVPQDSNTHWLTVVARKRDLRYIELDNSKIQGQMSWTNDVSNTFSVGQKAMSSGSHIIDSSEDVAVYLSGSGPGEFAYCSPGGMQMDRINQFWTYQPKPEPMGTCNTVTTTVSSQYVCPVMSEVITATVTEIKSRSCVTEQDMIKTLTVLDECTTNTFVDFSIITTTVSEVSTMYRCQSLTSSMSDIKSSSYYSPQTASSATLTATSYLTSSLLTPSIVESFSSTTEMLPQSTATLKRTISPEELASVSRHIREQLLLQQKSLSQYKRTLVSVDDVRTSATAIGAVGALVLVITVLFIVGMDFTVLFRDILNMAPSHNAQRFRRYR